MILHVGYTNLGVTSYTKTTSTLLATYIQHRAIAVDLMQIEGDSDTPYTMYLIFGKICIAHGVMVSGVKAGGSVERPMW